MSQQSKSSRNPHIVIVGGGLGGISTAIRLKERLHFENFTIYEKANAIGGTWRDNTYPGCGSDVPGHWYSLSTELNPEWSNYFVDQPEIRAYWETLYMKYGLSSHTKLGHVVRSAEWDSTSQRYDVSVENTATGEQAIVEADFMFYAIGGFVELKYPDIRGLNTFSGDAWHSAAWRHDVNLKGKRVGVIGNGCSAAQFVPKISEDSSVEVVNFCRTPQWYAPRGNYQYAQWVKWVFRRVPFIMRTYRNWIMGRSDLTFVIFRKSNTRLVGLGKRLLAAYIKKTAPKSEVANLIPDYPPGCKRIIIDPGYLESLNRSNVHLKWDSIESIVEDGIKLTTGEVVPLDVIIFGTGFSLVSADLRARGRTGETVQEYFASHGGPTAYLGTCIPGFPNMFTLLGPNVATGHASVIFSQESQIDLAVQLIKPVLDGQAKSFEVTNEATDDYNVWLQGRLSDSVWTQCNSYYQVGGEKQTKIVATFPGPVSLFWWMTRTPRWEAFRGVEAEPWERRLRRNKLKKQGLLLLLVLALGLGFVFEGQIRVMWPDVLKKLKRVLSLVMIGVLQ